MYETMLLKTKYNHVQTIFDVRPIEIIKDLSETKYSSIKR